MGRRATPQLSGGGLLLPPPFSFELAGAGLVPRALPYKAKKCWKAAVIRGGRGQAGPGTGERGWDGAEPSNQPVSQPCGVLPSLFCEGNGEGLGPPPPDQGAGPTLLTSADELGLVCPLGGHSKPRASLRLFCWIQDSGGGGLVGSHGCPCALGLL